MKPKDPLTHKSIKIIPNINLSRIMNDHATKTLDDVVSQVCEETSNTPGTSCDLDAVQYDKEIEHFGKKKVYYSWLLLCFSTGPVAAMSRSYVSAAIQSMANNLGHKKAGETCKPTGSDCYVRFGSGAVNFTAYVTYLKAIYTSFDGLFCFFTMGIVDYANYKKWALCLSMVLYGSLALPFAGLSSNRSGNLTAMSILYSLMNIVDLVYQIIEGAYIPLMMKAVITNDDLTEDAKYRKMMSRGSTISVMGFFVSNCGGLTALIIGIILSCARGLPAVQGYKNFLLVITIAGTISVVFSVFSCLFIPNTKAKHYPKDEFALLLSVKRFWGLLCSLQKYRMAFLYCASWVVWYAAYSMFLTNFNLLFRSTLGLGSSDTEYTIFQFMSYVVAMTGSVIWMFVFQKFQIEPKTWGYWFYGVAIFANFWGCLGISSKSKVGFKHRWEFWVFEVLFTSTSSALRSLNRALYSTLLPQGDEAQYFGLEVFLGIIANAFATLINGVIQDHTGNYHYPFIQNVALMCIACFLFWYVDIDKGRKIANKNGIVLGRANNGLVESEIEIEDRRPKDARYFSGVC